MKWIRGALAVILGYAVAQGLNGAFVYYWYFGDRSASLALLVPLTVIFFVVVAVGSGILVGRVGFPHQGTVGVLTGAFIAVVTIANMIMDVAAEPFWHKLVVLFVLAPLLAWSARRVGRSDDRTMGEPANA